MNTNDSTPTFGRWKTDVILAACCPDISWSDIPLSHLRDSIFKIPQLARRLRLTAQGDAFLRVAIVAALRRAADAINAGAGTLVGLERFRTADRATDWTFADMCERDRRVTGHFYRPPEQLQSGEELPRTLGCPPDFLVIRDETAVLITCISLAEIDRCKSLSNGFFVRRGACWICPTVQTEAQLMLGMAHEVWTAECVMEADESPTFVDATAPVKMRAISQASASTARRGRARA